jgi:hypothetical protein
MASYLLTHVDLSTPRRGGSGGMTNNMNDKIIPKNFYSISELMNRYELQKAIAEESLRGMRDELEKEKRN